MSGQPVSAVEVRRQIWESLVSMLRVYTHAASLNSDEYGVASTGDTVWITRADCVLHISYAPTTGSGEWRLEKTDHDADGTFAIDDEGYMLFPEGKKELDQAAIDWIEQLGRVRAAGIPA